MVNVCTETWTASSPAQPFIENHLVLSLELLGPSGLVNVPSSARSANQRTCDNRARPEEWPIMRVIVPTILCLIVALSVAKDARSAETYCPGDKCGGFFVIQADKSMTQKFVCKSTGGSGYPYVDWTSSYCVASPEPIIGKCTCWPSSPLKQSPTPTMKCSNVTGGSVSVNFNQYCSESNAEGAKRRHVR